MTPDMTEHYISLIERNRNDFDGKISVRVGFEVDFPFHDTFDSSYFNDERIDYFIGSCHYIGDWAFDHPACIDEFGRRDINEVYRQYYDIIGRMAGTGRINIIGHFDLVKKFGHRATADFKSKIEKITGMISNAGIAVEINTAGLRKPVGEIYPDRAILDIFFNGNVPITLGSDSHHPEEVGYMFDKAVEMFKKAGYRKISGFSKRKRYDITL
jgi:histidinol-phosphatase (PHP family)